MTEENLLDGKKILIVDDEPDVLETLEELLPMCDISKRHPESPKERQKHLAELAGDAHGRLLGEKIRTGLEEERQRVLGQIPGPYFLIVQDYISHLM